MRSGASSIDGLRACGVVRRYAVCVQTVGTDIAGLRVTNPATTIN